MRLVDCTKHGIQFSDQVMHFGRCLDNALNSDVHAQGASIPEREYLPQHAARSIRMWRCGCGFDRGYLRTAQATGRGEGFGSGSRHDSDHLDRRILEQPGEAHITTPRPQSRLPQTLHLLHRTGSIAGDAERQTEIETAVSRNQD